MNEEKKEMNEGERMSQSFTMLLVVKFEKKKRKFYY